MEKFNKFIDGLCIMITVPTLPAVYICFYDYIMEHMALENKTATTILIYLVIVAHCVTAKSLYDAHRREVNDYKYPNNKNSGADTTAHRP